MIDRFGPGVGHLNYLAVPGVGTFEFLFVPVTTNHFPGREFQLYLTIHFCPFSSITNNIVNGLNPGVSVDRIV